MEERIPYIEGRDKRLKPPLYLQSTMQGPGQTYGSFGPTKYFNTAPASGVGSLNSDGSINTGVTRRGGKYRRNKKTKQMDRERQAWSERERGRE